MDMSKSGVVANSDSGAFTDLNRLNKLKVGDRESDGNMRKVAQEFESLFLNEMLKSMRSANEVLGKDNPLNTPAAKQYQEMYDQQLSVTLSRQGGGIGLADVLMRQMSKNKAAVPGEAAATTALTAEVKAPAATTVDSPFVRSSGQRPLWASRVTTTPAAAADGHKNDMAMLNQRRLALPSKLTDRLLAGIVPSADPARTALNTATVPGRTSPGLDAVLKGSRQPMLSASGAQGRMQIYGRAVAQPPLAPAKQAFESPDAFVATMLPMAQQAADRIGVDPLYNYAHMPHLFKPQRRIADADLPTPAVKLELLALCIARLCAVGYVYMGMDHFAKPDDELAVAQRQGRLQRNFQGYSTRAESELISCGVSAISAVGATYSQNEKTLEGYSPGSTTASCAASKR